MNKNYIETFVGFLVLFVAAVFAISAYRGAGLSEDELSGYNVNVSFDRVDGLNIGSEVKISGLKVGIVSAAEIDPATYQAQVKLNIKDEIKIPDDSSAEVISAGLLGDKYIAIVPGGSEEYIKNGGKIKFSQSSVSLEALIGKFMFGSSSSDKDKDKGNDENGDKDKKEEENKSTF